MHKRHASGYVQPNGKEWSDMVEAATGDPDASEGSLIFGGFSEDRLRIDRIVSRLDVTADPIERADLGSELVRAVSRYEDTFERVLRPRLEESGPAQIDPAQTEALDRDREALRAGDGRDPPAHDGHRPPQCARVGRAGLRRHPHDRRRAGAPARPRRGPGDRRSPRVSGRRSSGRNWPTR